MREDYSKHKLEEKDVNPNPIFQFEKWFKEAKDATMFILRWGS